MDERYTCMQQPLSPFKVYDDSIMSAFPIIFFIIIRRIFCKFKNTLKNTHCLHMVCKIYKEFNIEFVGDPRPTPISNV